MWLDTNYGHMQTGHEQTNSTKEAFRIANEKREGFTLRREAEGKHAEAQWEIVHITKYLDTMRKKLSRQNLNREKGPQSECRAEHQELDQMEIARRST